jgi:aspartate kinase
MRVLKFGGTSVQDAAAINRVADIVAGKLVQEPVVVVSAFAKVTDGLLQVARAAGAHGSTEAASLIASLRERHLATARELLKGGPDDRVLAGVEQGIVQGFSDLEGLVRAIGTLGELTPRSQDAIASFGERLSSLIIAAAFRARGLPAELIDSRECLVTDNHFTAAAPDLAETGRRTRARILPLIESGRVPIAQGFIGSGPDGATTTIGRGGSDYSAAIFGAVLGAEAIEIWTDVDGLMTSDPRVVPTARRIRVVSFDEAAELSYFGAKVLHPSTVLPAVERGIPVHIYNTLNPSCDGTLIVNEAPRSQNLIKSIAFKRGVTIVNVASTRMLQAHGFLKTIFDVFDKYETSVDVVTTSEVSVSMTLDCIDRLDLIRRDLGGIGEVTVEQDKAIVCAVGDRIKFMPGVAARVFRAIEGINVNMISQGASEINLTFVIDEGRAEEAVRRLHDEFFSETDPRVFA